MNNKLRLVTPISEKTFQQQIVTLAKVTGWMVYHTYDSRKSEPGFPDLVMVKDGRLIFAEVKTEKGKLTEAQGKWATALMKVRETITIRIFGSNVGYFIWKPSNWEEIVECLK